MVFEVEAEELDAELLGGLWDELLVWWLLLLLVLLLADPQAARIGSGLNATMTARTRTEMRVMGLLGEWLMTPGMGPFMFL